jgi:hypothetical protein
MMIADDALHIALLKSTYNNVDFRKTTCRASAVTSIFAELPQTKHNTDAAAAAVTTDVGTQSLYPGRWGRLSSRNSQTAAWNSIAMWQHLLSWRSSLQLRYASSAQAAATAVATTDVAISLIIRKLNAPSFCWAVSLTPEIKLQVWFLRYIDNERHTYTYTSRNCSCGREILNDNSCCCECYNMTIKYAILATVAAVIMATVTTAATDAVMAVAIITSATMPW